MKKVNYIKPLIKVNSEGYYLPPSQQFSQHPSIQSDHFEHLHNYIYELEYTVEDNETSLMKKEKVQIEMGKKIGSGGFHKIYRAGINQQTLLDGFKFFFPEYLESKKVLRISRTNSSEEELNELQRILYSPQKMSNICLSKFYGEVTSSFYHDQVHPLANNMQVSLLIQKYKLIIGQSILKVKSADGQQTGFLMKQAMNFDELVQQDLTKQKIRSLIFQVIEINLTFQKIIKFYHGDIKNENHLFQIDQEGFIQVASIDFDLAHPLSTPGSQYYNENQAISKFLLELFFQKSFYMLEDEYDDVWEETLQLIRKQDKIIAKVISGLKKSKINIQQAYQMIDHYCYVFSEWRGLNKILSFVGLPSLKMTQIGYGKDRLTVFYQNLDSFIEVQQKPKEVDETDYEDKCSKIPFSFKVQQLGIYSINYERHLHQLLDPKFQYYQKFKKIKILKMEGCKLKQILFLQDMVYLTQMYLEDNEITKIKNISHLKGLVVLNLENNRLLDIDEEEQNRNKELKVFISKQQEDFMQKKQKKFPKLKFEIKEHDKEDIIQQKPTVHSLNIDQQPNINQQEAISPQKDIEKQLSIEQQHYIEQQVRKSKKEEKIEQGMPTKRYKKDDQI